MGDVKCKICEHFITPWSMGYACRTKCSYDKRPVNGKCGSFNEIPCIQTSDFIKKEIYK